MAAREEAMSLLRNNLECKNKDVEGLKDWINQSERDQGLDGQQRADQSAELHKLRWAAEQYESQIRSQEGDHKIAC